LVDDNMFYENARSWLYRGTIAWRIVVKVVRLEKSGAVGSVWVLRFHCLFRGGETWQRIWS